MMEENLRRALLLWHGDWSVFVTRPLSALPLVSVLLPAVKIKREEAFVENCASAPVLRRGGRLQAQRHLRVPLFFGRWPGAMAQGPVHNGAPSTACHHPTVPRSTHRIRLHRHWPCLLYT
jgi:hypothetical protein